MLPVNYLQKLPLGFWASAYQRRLMIETANSSQNMAAEAPQTSTQKEKEYVKVAPCLGEQFKGGDSVDGRHRISQPNCGISPANHRGHN